MYQESNEKKPYDIKDTGCNVYVTVICGDEKKKHEEKRDPCGKVYTGEYEKDNYGKKEHCGEGCNVFVTVYCDSCEKKKERD